MKSVVLERPGVVSLSEAEQLYPEPWQAVVRLRLNGICGSDLAAYRGTAPQVAYPCVLGHELLVDVLECPDRPELEGGRAVVEPLVFCGSCRACRVGRYNCCAQLKVLGVQIDGGLREVNVVDARRLYPVPEGMPDETAVLAEPTSIAYHAVQRSQVEAGQVAVVFGAGTIGLLIAQILTRGRGCRALVVDLDPWRLGVAERMGATPLQGGREELIRDVREATGGEMADVVFEATGNPVCTRMTTDLVAHAGKIVLIGWNPSPVEVDTVTLMRKEVDLLGSRTSVGAFPYVLRLLEDEVVDSQSLITHHFDLGDTASALKLLDEGDEGALKILVDGRQA